MYFFLETCDIENQEWNGCGSNCAPICSKIKLKRPCIKECLPGCYCKEGYKLDGNGGCISNEECEISNLNINLNKQFHQLIFVWIIIIELKCKEDEEFGKCGSSCREASCNSSDTKICTEECNVGCWCPQGFVRNRDTNECVLAEECKCKL